MGKMAVLVLCNPKNDLGKLIVDALNDEQDLILDLAEGLKEFRQKQMTQDYACVVIDLDVDVGFSKKNILQPKLEKPLPPSLYILHDNKDADSLLSLSGLNVIDFLQTPINETLLKNRLQILLELDSQKKRVSFYKEEFDEKSLELEVLYQELLETKYKLELLFSLDSLTGLFNRYYFDENLQKEWRQAVRQEEPLSLLFINVDLLKPYNEYYGRVEGDELLRQLAGVMHGTLLRPVDIVARYGGDQFAAILPGTDAVGAELVATRMLENVDALKKEHRGSTDSSQVSISIGGATMRPLLTDKVTEITEKAESALEEAKQAGRNRIFHR